MDPKPSIVVEPLGDEDITALDSDFLHQALATYGGPSLLDKILSDATYAAGIKGQVEKLIETLDFIRVAAVGATYPSDWVLHSAREGRQLAYLQDDGAQRAIPIWGMVRKLYAPPQREDYPDGTFTYRVRGIARCLRTGLVAEEIGSRWSGQSFFVELSRRRGWAQVDPTLVEKAALKNFDGRAFRYLSGLNGVPPTLLVRAWGNAEALKHCVSVVYKSKTEREPEAPVAIPTEAKSEREGLLASIRELADKLQLPPAKRQLLWKKHCGEGTPETVDLSALAALRADLTQLVEPMK